MCRLVSLLGCRLIFLFIVVPTAACLLEEETGSSTRFPAGLTGSTTAAPMAADLMTIRTTRFTSTHDPIIDEGGEAGGQVGGVGQPLKPLGCDLGWSKPADWRRPNCFWRTCRDYCKWLLSNGQGFQHNSWVFNANYKLGYSNLRSAAFWDTCKQNCKNILK